MARVMAALYGAGGTACPSRLTLPGAPCYTFKFRLRA
jgi:hypothetical protein